MSEPKAIPPSGSDGPLEYIGHLKFVPAESGPITPETTMEDCEHSARHEYVFGQIAIFFLSCTDEELEAWDLGHVDRHTAVCFLADLAGLAQDWIAKKKAGVEAYSAMFTRCKIIGERINARFVAN